ncbi:MAG: pectate lyase [Verrucomicrobia bacterium]|nr:pectate lyase [Verrucomicrobiota bacterium]
MTNPRLIRFLIGIGLVAIAHAAGPPLAFPGAEGHGRFAVGGRGGQVYAVTNLDDDGPGSLRDAVRAPNRTIVFRVSGTIDLKSDLVVTQSNLTLAGQSAPGDGICLKRHPLRIEGAKDIVVRFLRVRPGDEAKKPLDGIEIRNARNAILDHCSVSWSLDEGINTWHGAKNVTIQWCLISEGLNRNIHYAPHAFGASWGGENCSYHHNLFAHCTARNPSVAGNAREHTVAMDHRCSVIYNWEHRTCDGKPDSINVVNNYYKPGPATRAHARRRMVRIDDTKPRYGFESVWFIEGNMIEGAPELTADNWKGGVEFEGNTNERVNRRTTPFPFAPVTTQPAADVYRLVLRGVGARLPKLDAHDARILREVETGTATFGNGIIDTQTQVGGWPELKSAPAPLDTDNDGMPDAWERSRGLNPGDPSDRNKVAGDGYTQLEHYLNSLVVP